MVFDFLDQKLSYLEIREKLKIRKVDFYRWTKKFGPKYYKQKRIERGEEGPLRIRRLKYLDQWIAQCLCAKPPKANPLLWRWEVKGLLKNYHKDMQRVGLMQDRLEYNDFVEGLKRNKILLFEKIKDDSTNQKVPEKILYVDGFCYRDNVTHQMLVEERSSYYTTTDAGA